MENKSGRRQEMLSDDQVNEIIIEVENVPSGVAPEKTLVNSSFGMVSRVSDIDVTDSQSFSCPHDKKSKPLLRFSTSLNGSFSQTLHGPGSVGIDTPCTSHENIQGSETLGERS